MEYILYNGGLYCCISESGKITGSENGEDAYRFQTLNEARKMRKHACKKLSHYHVFLIGDYGEIRKVTSDKSKQKRKTYPLEVRKMIYEKANGRCELCGIAIKYKEMTLDHVVPLAMGGIDDVENLSCACEACNQFKGSILPETFINRITQIFMYQMEKKYGNKLRWKMIHGMLRGIIEKST